MEILVLFPNRWLCRIKWGEETHKSASVPLSCGQGLNMWRWSSKMVWVGTSLSGLRGGRDWTGQSYFTELFLCISCPFHIHSPLLTFFLCFIVLFQSCCSHAQVFGRTLMPHGSCICSPFSIAILNRIALCALLQQWKHYGRGQWSRGVLLN